MGNAPWKGMWEIKVDQKKREITTTVEDTKTRRRSRMRGSTLAEQVEEDDSFAWQEPVEETAVEEAALPLSPFFFLTLTDKHKERERDRYYISFFFLFYFFF